MENNTDGLIITHSNDGGTDSHFDWKDIKSKKNKPLPKEIEKWSNKDFYNYILYCFDKRSNVNFPRLNSMSGTSYIGYIRSKFLENFKVHISNKDLLNYINDSIEYTIDKKKANFFDIKYLSSSKRMNVFLDKKKDLIKNTLNDTSTIDNKKIVLSESILRAAFNLNCFTFIRKYGIIIPISYMIYCEKMEEKKSLDFIFENINDMLSRDKKCWEVILENTKKLGPYNTILKINGMKEKVIEIKDKFSLNTEGFVLRFYSKCDIPEFLRKENKCE